MSDGVDSAAEFLANLKGSEFEDCTLHLQREDDGRWAHVCKLAGDLFDEDEIRERWGPGRYKFRVQRPNGQWAGSHTFTIAGEVRDGSVSEGLLDEVRDVVRGEVASLADRAVVGRSAGRDPMLELVLAQMDNTTKMMCAMFQRPDSGGGVAMGDLALLLKAQRSAPVTELAGMLELVKSMTPEPVGGDELGSTLAGMLPVFMEAMQQGKPTAAQVGGGSVKRVPNRAASSVSVLDQLGLDDAGKQRVTAAAALVRVVLGATPDDDVVDVEGLADGVVLALGEDWARGVADSLPEGQLVPVVLRVIPSLGSRQRVLYRLETEIRRVLGGGGNDGGEAVQDSE